MIGNRKPEYRLRGVLSNCSDSEVALNESYRSLDSQNQAWPAYNLIAYLHKIKETE